MDDENRTTKAEVTVLFHERLEPIMDYFREDAEKTDFGELMFALLEYSMYGKEPELKDRLLRSYFKSLRAGVDLGRESSANHRADQIINSNLKYAKSEDDMKARLEKKGLSDEKIQNGVDRYRAKQNKDAGLNENGQFPKGTSWDDVKKIRGF